MKIKNILLILFVLITSISFAQTNTCQGTLQYSSLPVYSDYTLIGNGTLGCIRICITNNALSTSKCAGIAEAVIIRDSQGTIQSGYWYSTTANGTCRVITLADGYAWVSAYCKQAGSEATITWETVDCNTLVNVCCTPDAGLCSNGVLDCGETAIDCGGACSPCVTSGNPNYIGEASSIDACGTSFNVSNSGADAAYSSTQAGCGANLDCNTTTSHSGTAGNDVPWSIENDIWYVFCPAEVGSWTVTIDAPPCSNTGGYQYALFQGTPTNLHTQFFASQCQQTQGQSCVMSMNGTNSTTINVTDTSDCVYLVIDGHAGAVCDFSVSLTTTVNCTLLPIELLSFTGEYKNKNIQLEWVTLSEINNDYFTIERSSDGVNFINIATMYGAGNSTSTRQYFYEDTNPMDGINYYRLKQTDYDGKFEYFDMIAVSNKIDNKVNIYPNPTTNIVNVSLFMGKNDEVYIKVTPINGNNIFEKTITSNDGFVKEEIPLPVQGMYIVEVHLNGKIIREKVIRR